ncbi:PIR Superfamily Protein [Plasmodium ovale wallikeri]|uniref:PIR Superfamily Protein n=1 Tax=Plasmodium ovale wallikeri TaxID=864142 RepID=A0A1A9AQR0_PLAOA|nr:PIR Superfamily Protein [Plasmodium ovale wallikeri]
MNNEVVLEKILKALEIKLSGFPISNKYLYYSYCTNFNEPEKVIKVERFVDNISTIKKYLDECAPKEEDEAVISSNDDNPVVGGVTGTLLRPGFYLLALYRYSPVRSLIHSELQSWKRKNDNLDEKELLFDGIENHNAYSYNMEYDIQYPSQ